jgi:DNA polymerase III delta prime subunit
MRPKYLKDLVGQSELCSSLTNQLQSGRIPHLFIIAGNVGAGKTTLARIIALCLQVNSKDFEDLTDENWSNYKKYDITEINAANKNGVDDIRQLVENMKYRPMPPSKSKVVILDEAHQLTSAAQQALITETEDVSEHVYYIFCTSALTKIIPALQRRAFILTPQPLTASVIPLLVEKACKKTGYDEDIDELIEVLVANDITSPGLILQATERYFSGIPPLQSVLISESSKFDSMAICRAVASGKWATCAELFKNVTKSDVAMLRGCILGYLKSILLKSTGSKGLRVAKAIQCITTSVLDEQVCLPSFLAGTFIACEHLSPK